MSALAPTGAPPDDARTVIPVAPPATVRRHLAALLEPQRGRVAAAALAILTATVATFAPALLVRHAIDAGIAQGRTSAVDLAVAGLVVAAAAGAAAAHARIRLVARLGEDVLAQLRADLYAALCRRSVAAVERVGAGRLTAVATVDVAALTQALRSALPQLIETAALLVVAAVVLVGMSPLLAAVAAVGLPVVAVAGHRFRHRSGVVYPRVRAALADTVDTLGESVRGVITTRAFSREPDRERALARADGEVLAASFAAMRARNGLFPAVALAQGIAGAAVVGVGGLLALDGRVSVGTLAAFVLALASLFRPVARLSQLANTVLEAGAALARVLGVTLDHAGLARVSSPQALPARGALTLDGVTFGYVPGRPVVDDLSLSVPAGGSLALVGPTGAGKTSIARLLGRLADPDTGAVRFGGVDLRTADPDELRRRILLITQEAHLFPGRIADNVRLAAPAADDDDVVAALDAVGALGWVRGLPDGVWTQVGDGGAALSAGQQQLVALARIVVADPAVVLLDEATAALDPATGATVDQALRTALAGRTVVVIAHRLPTAATCDRIAVVEHGRLIEVGSHTDLLASGGRYAGMWTAWRAT